MTRPTRHTITVTAYHEDNSICPPEHRHTPSGKPLTEGCTGRNRFLASCSCKQWTSNSSSTKTYAAALGKRHRDEQTRAQTPAPSNGPAALRDLLRLDEG